VSQRDRAALEREGEDVLRFEAPEPAGRAH
jgi:hypothetical protein